MQQRVVTARQKLCVLGFVVVICIKQMLLISRGVGQSMEWLRYGLGGGLGAHQ